MICRRVPSLSDLNLWPAAHGRSMSDIAERHAQIEAFLRQAGFGQARRRLLEGDASFRRYHRIEGGPRPAMLMDADPATGEDCTPFLAVAEHLSALGFSAPLILAQDLAAGLLLLEDLGDALYAKTITPANEGALYAAAVDVLIALRGRAPERLGGHNLPRYAAKELRREADLLLDWYLPHITGTSVSQALRADYQAEWDKVWP